jgi:hypothetical protein
MKRAASTLLSSVCAGFALAGPPLETDDPDTPGPGNWEINVAATHEKRGIREFKPVLDLNYGVGNTLQLKLKPRLVILDEPSREARLAAGNIQFGVKWRFANEDEHGVALSTYPQLDLNPPGRSVARDLVDDGTEFFLPVELAWTLGRTRIFAEAGHNWREHRSDEWIAGIAAEHPLEESLRLVGELRGIAGGKLSDSELLFNAGFKWKLADHVTLLVSAGHTLKEARGESSAFFSYLGLQTTF